MTLAKDTLRKCILATLSLPPTEKLNIWAIPYTVKCDNTFSFSTYIMGVRGLVLNVLNKMIILVHSVPAAPDCCAMYIIL